MVNICEESNRGPRFFDLIIRFSDMCAFVPSPDGNQMKVLFPRYSRPKLASDGNPIQAHFPVLAFAMKDLRKQKLINCPDPNYKTLRQGPNEEDLGLWFLDNQDLEIKTASKTHIFQVMNSFYKYVPAMPDGPNSGIRAVKTHCLLDDSANPPQQFVKARMTLDCGNLSTKRVAKSQMGQEIQFQFAPPDSQDPNQFTGPKFPVAIQLELVIPDVEYVEFKATRFCDPTDVESLALASSRQDLIVEIKNEPVEELLGLPWEYTREDTQQARDFEVYYQLADKENGPLIPKIDPVSTITSNLVHCPQTLFQNHSAVSRPEFPDPISTDVQHTQEVDHGQ